MADLFILFVLSLCWFSYIFTCMVKSKLVKQEVSCTVMLLPLVSVLRTLVPDSIWPLEHYIQVCLDFITSERRRQTQASGRSLEVKMPTNVVDRSPGHVRRAGWPCSCPWCRSRSWPPEPRSLSRSIHPVRRSGTRSWERPDEIIMFATDLLF